LLKNFNFYCCRYISGQVTFVSCIEMYIQPNYIEIMTYVITYTRIHTFSHIWRRTRHYGIYSKSNPINSTLHYYKINKAASVRYYYYNVRQIALMFSVANRAKQTRESHIVHWGLKGRHTCSTILNERINSSINLSVS